MSISNKPASEPIHDRSDCSVTPNRRREFLRRATLGAMIPIAAATGSRAFAEEVPLLDSLWPFDMIAAEGSNDPREVFVDIRTQSRIRANFQSIQKHENDHVAALLDVLGGDARPKPTFQNLEQTSLESFAMLARTFENVGVGAYLGAAPAIFGRANLTNAGTIATVEARHAGFLNAALGFPVTQQDESFETALLPKQVAIAVDPFIASFNGGPQVIYRQGRSAANDIAILNFALALEFLEAEFYNINVPKFFA